VDAAFVLHDAIDAFASHGADDFLVAADGSLAVAADSHLPSFLLEEFRVHTEEVACEECRFVAAGAAAYLEDDVLVVLGVSRYEQKLYLLFQLGDALLALGQLLAKHFLCIGIFFDGEHFLGIGHVLQAADIFLACLDDFAQVLVFLGKLDVALLVSNDRRVGDEGADFLEAAHEPVELIE